MELSRILVVNSEDEMNLLLPAIESATEVRLRDTLREICKTCPDAFELACEKLLARGGGHDGREYSSDLENSASSSVVLDDYDEEEESLEKETIEPSSGKKRKRAYTRQRYEICSQCSKEYDTSKNKRVACVWHDGTMDVDWDGDFWADHDEDCHGVIETLRDEYPEGFKWDCCGRLGDKAGCKKGPHRAVKAKRAKLRTH